jgi:hypothetical protein
MRLALPEDVFVRLVETHTAARRQAEQIRIVDGVKRRMLFEEVSYAVADDSGFHSGRRLGVPAF